MPATKSLQDQVGEIRKLISDASETLRQANWAMETLVNRLDSESAPAASSLTKQDGDEPPQQHGRRQRWARGTPQDPPAT
jgi:hypothetical protein